MKTLGNRVIKFIENYCVHSTGDYLGKPFVLRDWQKEIIREMFTVREDGSFKYHTPISLHQKEMENQKLLQL